MALAPLDDRLPYPASRCLPDDRVGHAIGQRIAPAGDARLEHWSRGVPLEKMHASPVRAGEVRELVDEKALARARKSGEEHHPPTDESPDALREASVGLDHESRIPGIVHLRHSHPLLRVMATVDLFLRHPRPMLSFP